MKSNSTVLLQTSQELDKQRNTNLEGDENLNMGGYICILENRKVIWNSISEYKLASGMIL
jgi:hypothetical protein